MKLTGVSARGFKIDYETPKSENLHLFHLGERVYDHILFFPTKVKGTVGVLSAVHSDWWLTDVSQVSDLT